MQVPDVWWEKIKDKELEMFAKDPDVEDVCFTKVALVMVENIDWNVSRIMDKLKGLEILCQRF